MDLLLQTKLSVPVIRSRLVARSHLLQRLEDGLLQEGEFQRRLTLVTAPAGYGKTTLVASWLRATGRPFGWLSLEKADNDPSRFLAYLLAAAQAGGVGQAARQAMQSPQPLPPEAVVTVLLNEIAASALPITLALDDYHTIHNPAIHKIMSFFLEHQPARVHLVVLTREDPLLPVPHLRARGQALEIRQEDLRFTVEETFHFLREIMKLELKADEVAALEQRTEGWIAGLQLAALAMQGLPSGETTYKEFIRTFTGSSRFVIDYLISEVFQQQPAVIQNFMLRTALLDRMCASLCDALTGHAASQELLDHLEGAHLFLIPLDQAGEWYRYHHLFSEFLRHRLRVRFATEIPALHHTASEWYEAHGDLAGAVEHALAAASWERAGRLIDSVRDGMLRRGEIATLMAWYGRLPDGLVRASPPLSLGYAWPLVLSGQPERARSLIESVEPLIAEGSTDQGNMFALRAFLARGRGDHAEVIHTSERALELLAHENPAARGTLATNLGIAYWHLGRMEDTEKTMTAVLPVADRTGNTYAALTAHFFLARVLATRGQIRQAETQYLKLLHDSEPSPITALLLYDLGTLLYEWNRLDQVEQPVNQAIQLSARMSNAEFTSSGHILRAMVHLARRDHRAALEEASRAYDLAVDLPPTSRARSQALHVQIYLAMGDLEGAGCWAAQMPPGADVHPFYRFLDLTRPRLLLAQGRKEEARELLAAACRSARQNGWGFGLVAALVLHARAAKLKDEAVEALVEALRLAQPEGYLRTFLDAGPEIIPLLQEVTRRGIFPAYAGQILTGARRAFLSAPSAPNDLKRLPALEALSVHAGPAALLEPLSPRELEVLRLIVAGLSNREIARLLVISLGTAKTHVHNVCAKLGARSRTEAAVRARDLCLV